jgi:CRP-like cAMP-binding protein
VRPSTAIATEACSLFRIPRVVFVRILEGEPQAATALRRLISARIGKNVLENVAHRWPGFVRISASRG